MQTANSKQQTANSKQQTAKLLSIVGMVGCAAISPAMDINDISVAPEYVHEFKYFNLKPPTQENWYGTVTAISDHPVVVDSHSALGDVAANLLGSFFFSQARQSKLGCDY